MNLSFIKHPLALALLGTLAFKSQVACSDDTHEEKPSASQLAENYKNCLLNAALSQEAQKTLGEIRHNCLQSTQSEKPLKPLASRRLNEIVTQKNPFVITPHRLNYAILSHYSNGIHKTPFEEDAGKPLDYRDQELQFQLSFKIPLATQVHLFNKEVDIYGAYTNRSFWQFFDDEDSIPFRETNHEPELWAQLHTDIDFLNFNLHTLAIGINHQSNGQTNKLSRGWNRIFVQGHLQHKNSYLSFKTWKRFKEQDEFDNSFDYQKYLGDFEIEAAYRLKESAFAITVKNRYQWNAYGSIQLEYTYPLTKRLKGYVQLFNGYGDSLIDMEHYARKIGFGIVLVDRF